MTGFGNWLLRRSARFSTESAARELLRTAWSRRPGVVLALVVVAALAGVAGPLRFVAVSWAVAGLGQHGRVAPMAIAALVAVSLVHSVSPVLMGPLAQELGRHVDLVLARRVMRAVSGPPGIAHLENPAQRDLIAAARGIGADGGPGAAVSGYANLLVLKIGGFGSMALLATYRWWLGVGVAIGAMLLRRAVLRRWFETAEALAGDVAGLRRSGYLRDLVMRLPAAKESKVYGLRGWLSEHHEAVWSAAMAPLWAGRRRGGRRMVVVDVAVLALALGAVVPIVLGTVSGELSPARAVVLAGALSGIVALGGFLPSADFPIGYSCLALPPLRQLEASLPSVAPRHRPPPPNAPREFVRFEAVSFRYPRTERPVLEGLDFTIRAGSSVALVGRNGAGKTTLVKLLAGLAEPTEGRILVDGVDLREIDLQAWRRRLAVIFQDFARFELPARDNVGFGAPARARATADLDDVARGAGVLDVVRGLPAGWDTPLSPRFTGGAELSGGQWQRVALARMLLARREGAGVLILDEPTAALDVQAEADFNEHFLELAAGVTTLLVSHRFPTVRRAGRICVIDAGQVVEDGSHEELLDLGGRYATMFRLQSTRFADA